MKSPDVLARSAGTSHWIESTIITSKGMKEGEEFEYSRGRCGIPNEPTVIEEPKVRTEGKTITVVDENRDSAFASARGDLSEIKEFEDKTGVVVSGSGKHESNRVTTSEKHIGLGGYQETLIRVARAPRSR